SGLDLAVEKLLVGYARRGLRGVHRCFICCIAVRLPDGSGVADAIAVDRAGADVVDARGERLRVVDGALRRPEQRLGMGAGEGSGNDEGSESGLNGKVCHFFYSIVTDRRWEPPSLNSAVQTTQRCNLTTVHLVVSAVE